MRSCLAENLRLIRTMTLMTIGFYNEPNGSWLPSVAVQDLQCLELGYGARSISVEVT